jgi:hypothetical protein
VPESASKKIVFYRSVQVKQIYKKMFYKQRDIESSFT